MDIVDNGFKVNSVTPTGTRDAPDFVVKFSDGQNEIDIKTFAPEFLVNILKLNRELSESDGLIFLQQAIDCAKTTISVFDKKNPEHHQLLVFVRAGNKRIRESFGITDYVIGFEIARLIPQGRRFSLDAAGLPPLPRPHGKYVVAHKTADDGANPYNVAAPDPNGYIGQMQLIHEHTKVQAIKMLEMVVEFLQDPERIIGEEDDETEINKFIYLSEKLLAKYA